MTTLATGGSINVVVKDNGIIQLATNGGLGSVVVTPTGGSATTTNFGPDAQRRSFGPFSEGASAVLSNLTCANFDYEASSGFDSGSPLSIIVAGTPATLTNPLLQTTNSVNDYTQISSQNKSAGANASADHIAYPDNVTSSDLTGFVDIGITSSAFAQAAYTVTGANEAYLFGSAPSGASKSGSLVIATDSTGTNNNIDFYVGGFSKAKTAYSARFLGSNGLFQVKEGLSWMGKVISANGATVTYTLAAKLNYAYITTSAASLAFTLPAGAAAIDGLLVTIVTDTSVATLTWASTGTTFIGAPAASVANTPMRMIYDHASLKWYPA